MTLTIELTPEQEARLKEKAQARGQAAEEYAAALLADDLEPRPTTGAEAIAYWRKKGILGRLFADRPEDSLELARKLRQEAETRCAAG
jgi:hypothetical protein